MTQEHPITPPDYLVKEWSSINWQEGSQAAFADAARWGADQELEACREWLKAKEWINPEFSDELRAARRPKPPSLKEQALQELDLLTADATTHGLGFDASAIRRALESLPD